MIILNGHKAMASSPDQDRNALLPISDGPYAIGTTSAIAEVLQTFVAMSCRFYQMAPFPHQSWPPEPRLSPSHRPAWLLVLPAAL